MYANKLSVIILAGGKATRMGDVCHDIPKCMLPINGRPFIEYLVDWFSQEEVVDEIILSVGHLADRIVSHFEAGWWEKVRFVHEPFPLGTGGGLRLSAQEAVCNDILVCNGDTVVELPFIACLREYINSGSLAMTVLTEREDVPNHGAVLVGADDKVVGFLEGKQTFLPGSHTIAYRASSTGCYIFNRQLVLDGIPPMVMYSLEQEFVPFLLQQSLLDAYSIGTNFFWDFGTPDRIASLLAMPEKLRVVYGTVEQWRQSILA